MLNDILSLLEVLQLGPRTSMAQGKSWRRQTCKCIKNIFVYLGPVVRKVDSAIRWIVIFQASKKEAKQGEMSDFANEINSKAFNL